MADLLFFNPGCEIEVASGLPNYSLQKHPAMLERDLSVLPMFLSCPGDFVVSSTRDASFVDFWRDIYPCRFVSFADRQLRGTSLGHYRPWGISPRSLALAAGLSFSPEYQKSPVSTFTPKHKLLFSRESSASFFSGLRLLKSPILRHTTPADCLPVIARSVEEVEQFFEAAAQSRFGGSVLKAVYGSSGRGVRILRDCRFTPNIRAWVNSVIKAQGSVECEYLFNKVCDFSMHYDIRGGKATFVGLSQFSTADTGAYLGSMVKRLDAIPGFPEAAASDLAALHTAALQNTVYTQIYEGPLGIDCMVYRDGDSILVNPCVEINCRHSMGRLAMELSCLVDENAQAQYFVYQKDRPLPGMEQKPVFSNGKLVGGFLPLTPSDTGMFAAGILISSPASPCRQI
ncbi:MAG: hypothetical protein MJZ66_10075 [Bacteroidales bacterium]|nr:hypothetical protein [Bacteroidales bacterium]